MPNLVCSRREDVEPLCPHCGASLPEVWMRKPRGPFGIGQGYLFFCPACRKVLGTAVQWYAFPHRS